MIEIYIDGSSLGTYGYCIPSTNRKVIVNEMPMTNNQAEYLALLQLVMDLDNGSEARVYSDSQLLVHQINDDWKTKELELGRLRNLIIAIIKEKELEIDLQWICREHNLFGKILDKNKAKEKKEIKKIIAIVETV